MNANFIIIHVCIAPRLRRLTCRTNYWSKRTLNYLVYVVIILVMAVFALRRLLNVSDSLTSYFRAS